MPLDLKVIYLACNLKLCCINDTSNLATEALHSPSISLNKWASPKNKWKWQGIGTISDTGQHCKEYIITKYVVCCVVLVLCFVVRYFMFILVLQSSWWGQESWLLCLICLSGVSWWLSGSSSRCHGVVCGLWLWYFLIILTYYFWYANGMIFAISDQVSMLAEASRQVSAQEDIWFGRRCWLKNSKMVV